MPTVISQRVRTIYLDEGKYAVLPDDQGQWRSIHNRKRRFRIEVADVEVRGGVRLTGAPPVTPSQASHALTDKLLRLGFEPSSVL